MAKIDNLGVRIYCCDDPLHDAYERILIPKVRSERDQHDTDDFQAEGYSKLKPCWA